MKTALIVGLVVVLALAAMVVAVLWLIARAAGRWNRGQ